MVVGIPLNYLNAFQVTLTDVTIGYAGLHPRNRPGTGQEPYILSAKHAREIDGVVDNDGSHQTKQT